MPTEIGKYYIKFEDYDSGTLKTVVFEMSATSSVNYTASGKPTSNPVESGDSYADHYVNDNSKVSFEGILTNAWASAIYLEQNESGTERLLDRDADAYINNLEQRKESSQLFSVIYGNRELRNCLFRNLSISRDKNTGSNAWRIAFSAESINIVDQASIDSVTDPLFSARLAKARVVTQAKQEAGPSKLNKVLELAQLNVLIAAGR